MILATTLLALALSGMDDTASKPAPAAKGSAEVMSKADARTAPQTSPWDSIRQGPGTDAGRTGRPLERDANYAVAEGREAADVLRSGVAPAAEGREATDGRRTGGAASPGR